MCEGCVCECRLLVGHATATPLCTMPANLQLQLLVLQRAAVLQNDELIQWRVGAGAVQCKANAAELAPHLEMPPRGQGAMKLPFSRIHMKMRATGTCTGSYRQKPDFRGIFTARWSLGLLTSFLRHSASRCSFYPLNEPAAPTETPPAIPEFTAWNLVCAFLFHCRAVPRRKLGRPEPPTVPRAASPTPRWPLLGPWNALLSTARSPNMHVQHACVHPLILKLHGSRVCMISKWYRGSHSYIILLHLMTFECHLCVK